MEDGFLPGLIVAVVGTAVIVLAVRGLRRRICGPIVAQMMADLEAQHGPFTAERHAQIERQIKPMVESMAGAMMKPEVAARRVNKIMAKVEALRRDGLL